MGFVFNGSLEDLAVTQQYLDKERGSQQADEDDYQEYLERVAYAQNEQTMIGNVWPLLAKEHRQRNHQGYQKDLNFQRTEVEAAVAANISKPDISESYLVQQYPQEAVETLPRSGSRTNRVWGCYAQIMRGNEGS
jgi:hypothetical protein